MPRCSATRRASYTSSMEQQRPYTASGIPSRPASRRWFHSCSVNPTSVCPSAHSSAATAEESTPPDMATAIVSVCVIALNLHYRKFVHPVIIATLTHPARHSGI